MHIIHHAAADPSKPAVILATTGAVTTYAQLEALSNQSARALRALDVERGDVVASLFGNGVEVFVLAWATQRTGLYLTSISNKLSQADTGYILTDSGAKLAVASDAVAPALAAAAPSGVRAFGWSQAQAALPSWRAFADTMPGAPPPDQSPGADLLYSSGTTGRPKGVQPVLPEGAIDQPTPLAAMGAGLYGMGPDTVYLSTSPLYHAAPLRWALTVQRLGGTVVVMDRFEPEAALELIERYGVTHATFVPTHFVRMLKLPSEARARHGHASLKAVIHAAAPCPAPVKQAMIDWWGPILFEYYSGTENCGITALSSAEWLAHRGSVGRAVVGEVKILDETGAVLGPGREGEVYFAGGPAFAYLNDPEKTAAAHDAHGWATLGDIGRLDAEGYLHLTDRKSFMIISGGVNIYPQEIENLLVTHPAVADVAVIGLPDEDLGEAVTAVVQPAQGVEGDAALAETLRGFTRAALGGVKTPRRFVFRDELPREPTGKLMKRRLRDAFIADAGA